MQPNPVARQSDTIRPTQSPSSTPSTTERTAIRNPDVEPLFHETGTIMIGHPILDLTMGQVAELSRHITQKLVADFGATVGDLNPLHFDSSFAQRFFKAPIAHGAFSAGLISAAVGTLLPGPGTLYMTQDLRFLKPVFIGDTLVARIEVVELMIERNRARLKTTCLNQHGEEVLNGEAWVKPPKERIVYERVIHS